MIGHEDAHHTLEYDDYYKIIPEINEFNTSSDYKKNGSLVSDNFSYTSNTNECWMKKSELQEWIEKNKRIIGKF